MIADARSPTAMSVFLANCLGSACDVTGFAPASPTGCPGAAVAGAGMAIGGDAAGVGCRIAQDSTT